MKKTSVVDTSILAKTHIAGPEGRCYALVEIGYQNLQCEPGQYVMVKRLDLGFQWSYPHLVYDTGEASFRVIVSEQAKLYAARKGDAVQVFGANGKGVKLEEGAMLVAEPSTYFLMAPLAKAASGATLLCVGGEVKPFVSEQVQMVCECDLSELTCRLAEAKGPVAMALNPPVLRRLMENALPELQERTWVFASTEIGCGMNACKGCYLHSPEVRQGISVCCEGPYMPYKRIDFKTDEKCFHLFD